MNTQLIKTFCEFVRIPSPTGNEKLFSDFLHTQIQKLGYTAYQDKRGNILVKTTGRGEPLLLAAHIDTVPHEGTIKPIIKKTVITSDGTTILGADNKAIVAVLFELLKKIKQNTNYRPLDILFSVSEEAGVSGIETFAIEKLRAKSGVVIDAALPIGTIITGSPYYMSIAGTITGKEADASQADTGKSVLPALAAFLSQIKIGKTSPQTFVNIGTIHGGSAANALTAEVTFKGEIRSFDKKELFAQEKLLRSKLQQSTRQHKTKATLLTTIENHGYTIAATDPLVHATKKILKKHATKIIIHDAYWGVSDANNLNNRKIKTINLGYGAKNPHTTKETMPIADLEKIFTIVYDITKNPPA